uniref:Transmembrane serine protease 5 n=1 Tax=Anser cygnoides TaxID=8845 RepID=A0A8B9EBI2_ANSCY
LPLFLKDSAEASLRSLCTVWRLLLLLGAVVLLAGLAAGAWLLGQCLCRDGAACGCPAPLPGQHRALPTLISAACCNCFAWFLNPALLASVSFRINSDSSLLEARVRGRPGWLLACHERWRLRLGTQLCRHLGALRMTHQKGVNLTDVRVKDAQEFIQLRPGQQGSLEDMWQVRYGTCESGRIVALKCSECGLHRGALRVVGGTDAAPGRWPWQVSVRHGSRHHCGGSVLAPSWIVTAAHCVHRRLHASGWLVGAGVARGSIEQEAGVPVEKVIYHPLYNGSSLDYDIALMKLRIPLNFSDAIRAVCLPPSHRDLFQGTPCWVSGWGYTRPDQALVPLISTRRCNSSCMYKGELTATMLCAGYPQGKIDACQGDSGGPLVCQDELTWRLVGVVSWGQGCAEPNHPGVYTNVAQLLPWIYRTTEVSWGR